MLYKAIQKSNREIVLSLSPGPAHIDRAWQYCDMLPLGKVGKGFETGERLSVYQGRAEDHDDTMVHVPFSADDWGRAYQNG